MIQLKGFILIKNERMNANLTTLETETQAMAFFSHMCPISDRIYETL